MIGESPGGRVIPYVEVVRDTHTTGDFGGCGTMRATSMRSVTRIQLGEILLAHAQKAVPAQADYPGHVNVYALPHKADLGPNWTIQGFTPWTSDTERCRQ